MDHPSAEAPAAHQTAFTKDRQVLARRGWADLHRRGDTAGGARDVETGQDPRSGTAKQPAEPVGRVPGLPRVPGSTRGVVERRRPVLGGRALGSVGDEQGWDEQQPLRALDIQVDQRRASTVRSRSTRSGWRSAIMAATPPSVTRDRGATGRFPALSAEPGSPAPAASSRPDGSRGSRRHGFARRRTAPDGAAGSRHRPAHRRARPVPMRCPRSRVRRARPRSSCPDREEGGQGSPVGSPVPHEPLQHRRVDGLGQLAASPDPGSVEGMPVGFREHSDQTHRLVDRGDAEANPRRAAPRRWYRITLPILRRRPDRWQHQGHPAHSRP